MPKDDPLYRIARDQLTDSGTGIGSNYEEAITGSSRKNFTNYLNISLKSTNESKF